MGGEEFDKGMARQSEVGASLEERRERRDYDKQGHANAPPSSRKESIRQSEQRMQHKDNARNRDRDDDVDRYSLASRDTAAEGAGNARGKGVTAPTAHLPKLKKPSEIPAIHRPSLGALSPREMSNVGVDSDDKDAMIGLGRAGKRDTYTDVRRNNALEGEAKGRKARGGPKGSTEGARGVEAREEIRSPPSVERRSRRGLSSSSVMTESGNGTRMHFPTSREWAGKEGEDDMMPADVAQTSSRSSRTHTSIPEPHSTRSDDRGAGRQRKQRPNDDRGSMRSGGGANRRSYSTRRRQQEAPAVEEEILAV